MNSSSSKFLWHHFPKPDPLWKWPQAIATLRRHLKPDEQLDPKDLNEALLVLLKLCGDMSSQMLLLECIVQLPHVQKYGKWLSHYWFINMPKTIQTYNELFLKFDCQHSKRVFFRSFLNTFNMEIKNSPNVTSIPVLKGTWDDAELKPPSPESFWLDINMGASRSLSFYVDKATFPTQETKCEGTSCGTAVIIILQHHISNVNIIAFQSPTGSSHLIEFCLEIETSHFLKLLIEAKYKDLLIKTLSEFGLCVKEVEIGRLVNPPQTSNPTPNEHYCWFDSGLGTVDSAASRVCFLHEESAHMTLSSVGNNNSELSQEQSEQEKSNKNKSNQQCATKLEPEATAESRTLSSEPKLKFTVRSGKRRERVEGGQGQKISSYDQLEKSCDEKGIEEVPILPVSKRSRNEDKVLEDKPRKREDSICMKIALNSKLPPKNRKIKREVENYRLITRSAHRNGFIKEEVTELPRARRLHKKLRENLPSVEIPSDTSPGDSNENDQSNILSVKEEVEALQSVQEREADSEDSKPHVNLCGAAQQSMGASHPKLELSCCKTDSSLLPATCNRDIHIVPQLSGTDAAMKQSPGKSPFIVTPLAQSGILVTTVDSGGQELSERIPLSISQFSHSFIQQSSVAEEPASRPLSLQSEVQTDMQESTSAVDFAPQHRNVCVDGDPKEPLPQSFDVQVVYENKSSPDLVKMLPCQTLYQNISSSPRTQSPMPKGVPLNIGFKHRNTLNYTKSSFNPASQTTVYQVKSPCTEIATASTTPGNHGSSLMNVPCDYSKQLSAPKAPFLVSIDKQKSSEGNESPKQCDDADGKNIFEHLPSNISTREHDYDSQHSDPDTSSVTAISYAGENVAVNDCAIFHISTGSLSSEEMCDATSSNLRVYTQL